MSENFKYGSVLQSYQVGYMYNLEGPGTESFFRNWMSSAFMVPEMPENFVKLALVEGSQPTENPTPVYVDLSQYPNALPSYSVPLSLTPSSSIYLDNHSALSAISFSSSSVDFSSWECSFQDLLSPNNITDIMIANHDAHELRFELVLHTHMFEPPAAAVVDIPFEDFINCDPQVFNKGIKYCSNFFRFFFPAAWVIILDTHTKMKNILSCLCKEPHKFPLVLSTLCLVTSQVPTCAQYLVLSLSD
ncbi:hypothetical protein J3A83DRAFT_4189132 [Scleroderma citrinum]